MSKKIVALKSAAVPRSSSKKTKSTPAKPALLSEADLQAKINEYNKDIITPDVLLGTPKGRNALLTKKIKLPFNWMGRAPNHLLDVFSEGCVCRSFDQHELNRKLAEMHRKGDIPEGYICKLLRAGIIKDMFGLLKEIFGTKSITNADLVIFDQIAKLVSPLMKVPRPELPITTYDILVLFFSAHHDQVPVESIEKVVDFQRS